MFRLLLPLLALLAAVGAAETKTLHLYWTATPPTLDGNMDEPCWQTAEVAKDFTMLQSTTPANEQTEVRACYDADNVYFFYTLFDSDMQQLMYGQPEDMRDVVTVFNDLAELFLDPGRTQTFRYQMMVSPLAARFDQCTGRGRPWNPEWSVKAGIFPDRWTLEMAIPFRELAVSVPEPEYDARFRGTPMPGDLWGGNFCRDQGRLREWSYWQNTGMSFHNVKDFAIVEFAGHRDGKELPTVAWQHRTSLYYGPGSVDLEVGGPAKVEFVLRRDGQEIARAEKAGPGTVSFPYHILESGRWTVDVTATANGTTVFSGRTVSILKPLGDMLADIKTKTAAARASLDKLDHPAAADLRARLDKITETAAAPLARIADPRALSRADWQAIEADFPALRQLWTDAEYDVHLASLYPAGEAGRLFALAAAGPDVRIHRRELLPALPTDPIRLAQAGGEYESFQVLVLPFWRDLADVNVTFSELQGDTGTVAADNFTWHTVDYVQMNTYDPEIAGTWEFEPDILWPGKPFAAPAGRLQPVLVDLYLPPNTPAGTYRGTVTVSAGGQSQSLPVEVQAYGFNIPARNTLEQDPWYAPSAFWAAYFGKHHGSLPFSVELYERHQQVLSRYRMACFPLDYFGMWQLMTTYREPDGVTYTFDFSEWQKIVDIGHRYGAHGFGASGGCNGGAFRPFMWGLGKMIDRATGEKLNGRQLTKEWTEKVNAGEAYWDTHPWYAQFMTQYTAFMRRNGLLEQQDFEMHDEPKSIPHMQRLVRHHQLLRRIAPEIKFKNYGFGPNFHPGNIWALGWADTWAPNLNRLSDDVIAKIHERRARWGEKFWFYTCGEGTDPAGNRSLYIVYDNSYLAPRIHTWVAWKVRADGFLIFMLNGVPKPNERQKDKPQFPDVPWQSGPSRGTGTLVYPTPEMDMLPSMRLTNYRDGLEDFEYFNRLHDRMRYLVPDVYPEHAKLWKAAEAELEVPKDVIDGPPWNQWTHDRALLNAKRDRIAALIRQIEQLAGIAAP